jgi:hypothetical protein
VLRPAVPCLGSALFSGDATRSAFSDFATDPHRGHEIADPFGRTLPYYRASFEEIRECVAGLLRLLSDAA